MQYFKGFHTGHGLHEQEHWSYSKSGNYAKMHNIFVGELICHIVQFKYFNRGPYCKINV